MSWYWPGHTGTRGSRMTKAVTAARSLNDISNRRQRSSCAGGLPPSQSRDLPVTVRATACLGPCAVGVSVCLCVCKPGSLPVALAPCSTLALTQ
eukprot:3429481-Rhodomonas_salina.1